MQRKRDSVAPIGNLFSELEDGPVETLRQPSPQALHHFTRADQVNQLVGASEADTNLGFIARLMALCSLPRTNPGDQLQYKRVNGPYKLIMFSSGETRLPYGNLPRLLLAWVSTEAVKTQSPVLVLGNSLAEFMRKLGIKDDSGSPRGDRTRLRNQMDRLFSATFQFIYEDRGPDDSTQVKDTFTSPVARKTHLVWNPKRPNAPVLWESKIELGWDFFNEIIRHPGAARHEHAEGAQAFAAGARSLPVGGLYRTFILKRPLWLSWRQLYRQFGADPAKADDNIAVQHFRTDSLRELKKIKTGLAGAELRNGQRCLDPLSFSPRHRTFGSPPTSKLSSQVPFPAPRLTPDGSLSRPL